MARKKIIGFRVNEQEQRQLTQITLHYERSISDSLRYIIKKVALELCVDDEIEEFSQGS